MPTFNQDTFSKAVNSTFKTQFNEQMVEFTLTECINQTSEAVPDYERFSLIFESAAPLLEQAMYPLEHAELGTLELFLVPVHGDDKGFQYEAIFNHKINS